MELDTEKDAPSDVKRVFVPRDPTPFPFTAPSLSQDVLYEPFEVTMAATSSYLNDFVVPRLSSVFATQDS